MTNDEQESEPCHVRVMVVAYCLSGEAKALLLKGEEGYVVPMAPLHEVLSGIETAALAFGALVEIDKDYQVRPMPTVSAPGLRTGGRRMLLLPFGMELDSTPAPKMSSARWVAVSSLREHPGCEAIVAAVIQSAGTL